MFDEKDPAEHVTITFDYSQELGLESIVAASVLVIVLHGIDPSPLSMLNSAPSIIGAQVLQAIKGGISGVQYEFKCTITTSGGRILTLGGPLSVSLQ